MIRRMTFPHLLTKPAPMETPSLDQAACAAAWRRGNVHFEAKDWEAAAQSYAAALLAHGTGGSISRRRIERQLRRCRLAKELNRLAAEGRAALSAHNWSDAALYLRQACTLYEPGLGQDHARLTADLMYAERGYRYQDALRTARESQKDGLHPLAIRYYGLAMDLHHSDYGPARLALESEYSALLTQAPAPTPMQRALRRWPLALVALLMVGSVVLGLRSPQAAPPVFSTVTTVADQAEVAPTFPGGRAQLQAFLRSQLQYPPEAQAAGVSGNVIVRFEVQPNGSLDQIEITKGIGYGCSEEALRVIKAMPRWVPGQRDGQAVPMVRTLAIRFEQA